MKDLDWSNLSFGYMPTDYNVRCYYRNGKWGEIEVCSDEYVKLHMAATCLHYGQEAFEGLKAYRGKDGKVRVFRVDENAARLQSTCRGILMPEVPTELFEEMVKKVVRLNQEFIPTYESGATLYVRPLLIGTSAQVGVHPSTEYLFTIFVTPVGPYFKGGFSTNPYVIIRDYDRSAPLGTGIYKVGGNYAASLKANALAHEKGYACEFYLDAKEKKYMDECGAANFFGIKNNTYVTPKSTSILNKSVTELVKDAVGAVSAATAATNSPKALPYLIRVSTEERIMLNKAIFKIGKATRGVDYTIGGNGAISRQHAFIIQKDGVCYIKDNKSTNHTYVNGKRVEDGVEEILTHDSLVRLADEEFTFKIR